MTHITPALTRNLCQAIRDCCLDCADKLWFVEQCGNRSCPLWRYRPVSYTTARKTLPLDIAEKMATALTMRRQSLKGE